MGGGDAAERLPVMTITAAADPAPAQSDEVLATPALRGHVLGNVPVASVRADDINGDPDITANKLQTHDPRL